MTVVIVLERIVKDAENEVGRYLISYLACIIITQPSVMMPTTTQNISEPSEKLVCIFWEECDSL